MADHLFKVYMIPGVIIALILYGLPDFSLKIPLGLLVLFGAAVAALYQLWEAEQDSKDEPDVKV